MSSLSTSINFFRSATFLPILKSSTLFATLLPYFVISIIIYALLLTIMRPIEEETPRKIHEYEDINEEKNTVDSHENGVHCKN